jgi:tRNA (guanine37-N1)-methyltransferase
MKIDILSLFPKMFKGPFAESIVKRAQEKELVEINIHNLRQWAKGKHRTVDDRPYGGGVGMVLMVEPIYKALKFLKKTNSQTILLTPQGKTFNQKTAQNLAKKRHLVLICGHYEGVDERVRKHLVDKEISIGDYILTGGELPAMVITDTLVRLIPGVLEKSEAIQNESFSPTLQATDQNLQRLLEYPQYTRPESFQGWEVPQVLLSGNHAKIDRWRKDQSLKRTQSRHPSLLNL